VKTSVKHIGLLSGIIIILLSFLFFGRQQEIYQFTLICGILISLVCFLWILLGKENIRSKVTWIGVSIVGMALVWGLEGFFIDLSYRIFLHTQRNELASVNHLLKNTPGEVTILGDSIRQWPRMSLSDSEKEILKQNFENLGVYMISKNDSTIYYGLWGFLDVRLGITYCIGGRLPKDHYRQVKGNWYL
jgi:hypothetical protein